jgi:hypothetical protein
MLPMLLTLWGCASEPPPPSTRCTIRLEEGWSLQPWNQKRDRLVIIDTETRIAIPPQCPVKGASLELGGLWWSGQLWVNGEGPTAFTGGIVPADVPIGDHLRTGENRIRVRVEGPKGLSTRLTGGKLHSTHQHTDRAKLEKAPVLHLRPASHIASMAIPMQDGKVHPEARLENAEGGRVHFRIVQDGEVVQDLGWGDVDDGTAKAPAGRWKEKKWDIGSPALYQLVGELFTSDGERADMHSVRTGARELGFTEGTLLLNGRPLPLMGGRAVVRRPLGTFQDRIVPLLRSGINAIEFHGEVLEEGWLDAADELGLPVVWMPRCIGRANDRTPGSKQGLHAMMEKQDERLLRILQRHPSVVLLAVEGEDAGVRLHSDTLLSSAHGFKVAGRNLESSRLRMQVAQRSSQCLPGSCADSWIVEVTLHDTRGTIPWKEVSQSYLDKTAGGHIGGIIPLSKKALLGESDPPWEEAWKKVAAKQSIPQIPIAPTRSMSQIRQTSNTEGVLLLSAPWLTPTGAVAGNQATSTLRMWHRGKAELWTERGADPIDLQPENR